MRRDVWFENHLVCTENDQTVLEFLGGVHLITGLAHFFFICVYRCTLCWVRFMCKLDRASTKMHVYITANLKSDTL